LNPTAVDVYKSASKVKSSNKVLSCLKHNTNFSVRLVL
jgi:hypothetical protein